MDENKVNEEKVENEINKKHKHHPEIHVNKISMDAKKSFINRCIIAIILVAVTVPCLVLGDYVFMVLIFLASLVASHEITKAPQSIEHKFKRIIFVFAFMMMFLLIFWIFVKNNIAEYIVCRNTNTEFHLTLYQNFKIPEISLSAFGFSVFFLFLMVLIDKNFTVNDAFYFIGMLFVVSVGFQSILFLRFYPLTEMYLSKIASGMTAEQSYEFVESPLFKYGSSICLIIYTLLGTVWNDVGAYIFGSLFGSHKMSPRISPHKTWEGFAGGCLTSFVFSFSFGMILAFCNQPILLILDKNHWYFILILSLLMPFLSTFGDLIFSSVKRFYKIKDFGQALKSHGGILDRLDSALITSILLGLLIPLMSWFVTNFNI